MKIKSVMRYSPSERIFRLCRIVWERGVVGDGSGYSAHFSIALCPVLFRWYHCRDRHVVTLLGGEDVAESILWRSLHMREPEITEEQYLKLLERPHYFAHAGCGGNFVAPKWDDWHSATAFDDKTDKPIASLLQLSGRFVFSTGDPLWSQAVA